MKIGRALLFGAAFFLALYLVHEPLLRPDVATVRWWLDGKTIMVERGADSEHFVFEPVQAAKIAGLKHVSGDVYRNFARPNHGTGTYAFDYPHGAALQHYRADIRYTWQLHWSGIKRVFVDAKIIGPRSQ